MTTQAPPGVAGGAQSAMQTDEQYPTARVSGVKGPGKTGTLVEMASDRQSEHDDKSYAPDGSVEHHKTFVLDGAVDITYEDREVQADHIEYDSNTGDVTATGHLVLRGGPNDERIEASHGTFNLKTETGKFYDVKGSVGLGAPRPGKVRTVYTNGAPFLFTGRMVVKTGPVAYDLYEGSVTSCLLPNPDWLLTANHFAVADGKARGYNSTFHLLHMPVLFLPYVTHPTDPDSRQSGIMIPTIGDSTQKGITFGEQFYLVLNRSMDLTLGATYYSSIGWAEDATFRYKGPNLDFVKFRYTGVIDRRPAAVNQGGEDAVLGLRRDFDSATRFAGNVEYLSSYVYREAFTDNFNEAVTSDIVSTAYVTHQSDGMESALLADRYQGIKVIETATTPQEEVHILHTPTVSFAATEHRLAGTGLELSLVTSVSGLKRTQPGFETGGVVERIDVRPEASLPFSIGGWRFRPLLAMEETAYSRSGTPPQRGQPPVQDMAALSRSDVHFEFGARTPVMERVFTPPARWASLLGSEVKHTIEAEATYRVTKGVNDFEHTLRFDPIDVVADTNEVEYGLTQRLFRKRASQAGCVSGGTPNDTASLPDGPSSAQMTGGLNPDPTLAVSNAIGPDATKNSCDTTEMLSWRLTQKYFLDPAFGGAVVDARRNIFDTTLSLTGIAFLTEPREISPLISRMRLRSSAHTDIEWDFDLDTGAKKLTSTNLYLDAHASDGVFGALSYARLDAPGRFYTQGISYTSSATGVTSSVPDFNQLRLLLGYGSPIKPGLSLAANGGLDLKHLYGATANTLTSTGGLTTTTIYPPFLQYASLQANYNWNCCGLSVEYRKFELGSVRNEGTYKFNLTLANIGSAGNLRRSERIF